jgi:hypothetical protein
MTELLDVEGPWNPDLLATMTTEALRIRERNKKETFVGTVAAVATFFGKSGSELSRSYGAAVDAALEAIEGIRAARRGEEPKSALETAADKLEEILEKLPGLKG